MDSAAGRPLSHPQDGASTRRQGRSLDAATAQALDDLTALAAHVCLAPLAELVLVRDGEPWFRASVGLSSTSWTSFSARVMDQPLMVMVDDTAQDPGQAGHALAGGLSEIRFFAGLRLSGPEGHPIGTLCVMDRVPRELTEAQQDALSLVGRQVTDCLRLHAQVARLAVTEASDPDGDQTGHALRTAHERTHLALRLADVGIWDLDCGSGVLRWSEVVEGHYGLPPFTFGGTVEAFLERVLPEDRDALRQVLDTALASGGDFTFEHRSLAADGTVRWLASTGRILLDEHGKPLRGLGISQDLTARRRLEEQSCQAQKIDALGRLAGGVAHDFNNTLMAILGLCEFLLEGQEPGSSDRDDISEIQKVGLRAAEVTRQLLAFSRKDFAEVELRYLKDAMAGSRRPLEPPGTV